MISVGDKMLKYFKWFFLGILIICIGITIFLYIDFIKENNSNNEVDVSEKDDISIIYNKYWYVTDYKIYVDGQLVDEMANNSLDRYLTFTDKQISYCEVDTDECQRSEYSYSDGRMEIPVTFFASRGMYDIIYDEKSIMFSLKGDNTEFLYYFEPAVG